MKKETVLDKIVAKSDTVVHKGRYAFLKLKGEVPLGEHFMLTKDADEITLVTREENVANIPHEELVGYYTLIEFRCAAPFNAAGFLEKISGTVSRLGSCCLIVSTFSKDYCLVKEANTKKAVDGFRLAGFPVIVQS